MTTTVFTYVRVFDGNGITEPSTVVVTDGVITAVTADGPPACGAAEDGAVVDGRGRTLLPGLIDAHVHVRGREDLDALAAHGVTTGIDMASWPPDLTRSLRAEERTATIPSAGIPFIGSAGPHSHFPGMPAEAIVTDPELAAVGVAQRIADGSDFIKVVADGPGRGGLPPEVSAAVVTAAHATDRKVVAHASHIDAFLQVLEAGVDVITHVPTETAVDPELARRMAVEGRISIPTLSVAEVMTAAMPRPGADFATAHASVVAIHEAGVPILAGTDSLAAAPGMPFAIPLGATLHRELVLLVAAGLTPVEVLRAATSGPAAFFGLDHLGAIREGMRADLLLVDGDPTVDITATSAVAGVWIAGEPFFR
jgi:imidazolonepropionase-like amidohydrolase